MEATEQLMCRPVDAFNPLVTTTFQVSCILVISHIFHLLLKPLGQPGPFAQIIVSIYILSQSLTFLSRKIKTYIQWNVFNLFVRCIRLVLW